MESMHPWGDSFPYNNLAFRNKQKYGFRVQKVAVYAPFTCPNRDGSLGIGGCHFCNNDSFVPSYARGESSIIRQIDSGLSFVKGRYPRAGKFVAYFQAYTNTYGEFETLKKIYLEALSHPDISGIAIGTRPDCINDELLSFFAELSKEKIVTIEYGIESCDNKTLENMNRGHSFEQSRLAVEKTAALGISVAAHFIWGFNKNEEFIKKELEAINSLPLSSIKFHQLQIVKNTTLEKMYSSGKWTQEPFSLEQYTDFLVGIIECLRPEIAIERLCSETPPSLRVAPNWGTVRVKQVQDIIVKKLLDKNSFQGKYL